MFPNTKMPDDSFVQSFVGKYPYKIVWIKFPDGRPVVHNVRVFIGDDPNTVDALKNVDSKQTASFFEGKYGKDWRSLIGLNGPVWDHANMEVRLLEKPVKQYDIDDIFMEKAFRRNDVTGTNTVIFYNKLLFQVDTLVEVRHIIASIERVQPDGIFLFNDIKRKEAIEFTVNNMAPSLNDVFIGKSVHEPHIDEGVTASSSVQSFSTKELSSVGYTIYFCTIPDLAHNIARFLSDSSELSKMKMYNGFCKKYFPMVTTVQGFEKIVASLARKDPEESVSPLWAMTLKKNELYNFLFTTTFPTARQRVTINSIILRNEETPTVDFIDTRVLFEISTPNDFMPAVAIRLNDVVMVKQSIEDYKGRGARFTRTKVPERCCAFEHRMSKDKRNILYTQIQTVIVYPDGRVENAFNVREEIGIKLEDLEGFIEHTNVFIGDLNRRIDIFSMIGRRLRYLPSVSEKSIANINVTIHFQHGSYGQFKQYLNMFSPFIENAPDEYRHDYRDMMVLRKIMRFPNPKPVLNEFTDKNYKIFQLKFNDFMIKHSKIYVQEIKSLAYLREVVTLFDHIVRTYNNLDKMQEKGIFLKPDDAETTHASEANRLKKYQALDPDTYMYHEAYPDAAPFSTKCQYIRQASVMTKAEFDKLQHPRKADALKYKSATTGEDLYFVCMHSDKYKYPGFLSPSSHPTGKCAVCCTVEKQWAQAKRKKKLLYDHCMQKQVSSDVQTGYSIMRYLSKYSDTIQLGRFTDMPPEMESIFNNVPSEKLMRVYKLYGSWTEDQYSFFTAVMYAYKKFDLATHATVDKAREETAEMIYNVIQTCIDNIDVKKLFSRTRWRSKLSFDSVDTLRQTIIEGNFTLDESIIIFKPMLEITLDIHIIIVSVTSLGVEMTGTLNSIQEFMTESRPTVIILRTAAGNFYPVYYIMVNRYSASHRNIKSIVKSMFNRGDPIVNTLLAIWRENYASEHGSNSADIMEQFINRDGVVSFVKLRNGLIVPRRMRVDAKKTRTYIQSHALLENDFAASRGFLTEEKYVVLRDEKSILGVYLSDGGVFFIKPTSPATFEKHYTIADEVYVTYGFDSINHAILQTKPFADERVKRVRSIEEDLEIYSMLKLALVKSVRRERNKRVRTQIISAYESLEMHEFIDEIGHLMSKYDWDTIMRNINNLEQFLEIHSFDFDRVTYRLVNDAVEKKDYKSVVDIIRDHIDPHVEVKSTVDRTEAMKKISNVTYFCGESVQSSRCHGSKLILSKAEYMKLMSRLVQEIISGEMMRVLLLNGVFDRVTNRDKFTVDKNVAFYSIDQEGVVRFI